MKGFSLGWVVAFLEGEGTFQKGRSIQVRAYQVQRWPLERLKSIVGGNINPRRPGPLGSKPSWQWTLTSLAAEQLMVDVFVHLSPVRQGQILTCFEERYPTPRTPGARARSEMKASRHQNVLRRLYREALKETWDVHDKTLKQV